MDYEKKEGSESSARERRIERVQSMLSGFDVAGMLFFEEANIRYLTGFAGSDGALLVRRSKNPSSRGWKIYNAGEGRSDGL